MYHTDYEGIFMKKPRPIHLNFLAMRFPLTAWVSISHRLSGFWIFMLIPSLLWILDQSLQSPVRFRFLKGFLEKPFCKIMVLSFLAALCYHTVAGFRHLFIDLGIGTTKTKSTGTAQLTLIVSVLLFLGLLYRFSQ